MEWHNNNIDSIERTETLDIKRIQISFYSVLILWDVLTTYFGSLSILSYGKFTAGTFFENLPNISFMMHIVSILLGLGLIAVILGYKQILRSKNNVTRPLLVIAFLYDLGTSFYGTGMALDSSFDNPAELAIISVLVLIVASAPMLISQALDN